MPVELPTVVDEASGSVGDTVFARNAHRPYSRPRTTPTDPNTIRQQRVRSRWANVAWRWANALTQADRDAWNDYAREHWHLGWPAGGRRLSGQQHFTRANYSRTINALGWVNSPPTSLRAVRFTLPANVNSAGLGFIFYNINPADEWAALNLCAMVLFVSDVQPSTINFFAGPFRRSKVLRAYTGAPLPTLQWMADPWGTPGTGRRWLRSFVVMADGRVSSPAIHPFDDNP